MQIKAIPSNNIINIRSSKHSRKELIDNKAEWWWSGPGCCSGGEKWEHRLAPWPWSFIFKPWQHPTKGKICKTLLRIIILPCFIFIHPGWVIFTTRMFSLYWIQGIIYTEGTSHPFFLPSATSPLLLICQKDVWYSLCQQQQQQREDEEDFTAFASPDCDIFIIISSSNTARFLNILMISFTLSNTLATKRNSKRTLTSHYGNSFGGWMNFLRIEQFYDIPKINLFGLWYEVV